MRGVPQWDPFIPPGRPLHIRPTGLLACRPACRQDNGHPCRHGWADLTGGAAHCVSLMQQHVWQRPRFCPPPSMGVAPVPPTRVGLLAFSNWRHRGCPPPRQLPCKRSTRCAAACKTAPVDRRSKPSSFSAFLRPPRPMRSGPRRSVSCLRPKWLTPWVALSSARIAHAGARPVSGDARLAAPVLGSGRPGPPRCNVPAPALRSALRGRLRTLCGGAPPPLANTVTRERCQPAPLQRGRTPTQI